MPGSLRPCFVGQVYSVPGDVLQALKESHAAALKLAQALPHPSCIATGTVNI